MGWGQGWGKYAVYVNWGRRHPLLGILGRWPGAGSERDSPTCGRIVLLQMPAVVLLRSAGG